MNPTLKNILAVLLGFIGGSIVNMSLVQLGHTLFPIEGVDLEDMEAMAAVFPTLDFQYFVFPFLAHALGTLVGAILAGRIAASKKMTFSFVIGGVFMLGGITMVTMIPEPIWFAVTDLTLAYIPMAWIGGKIALNLSSK